MEAGLKTTDPEFLKDVYKITPTKFASKQIWPKRRRMRVRSPNETLEMATRLTQSYLGNLPGVRDSVSPAAWCPGSGFVIRRAAWEHIDGFPVVSDLSWPPVPFSRSLRSHQL
jgi:hypothetical protein